MHEEDEIRYILSGSGFVDVRGGSRDCCGNVPHSLVPPTEAPTDAWIRIAVAPGDLLVYPAGIYHRFSLDERDNMTALRLSQVRREG
jgi:1,2-dihydroxy-3-keto-5-methylthiopentene dioxygenase